MSMFIVAQIDHRAKQTTMFGPFYDEIAAYAFGCRESLVKADERDKFDRVDTFDAGEPHWRLTLKTIEGELICEWRVAEVHHPRPAHPFRVIEDHPNLFTSHSTVLAPS